MKLLEDMHHPEKYWKVLFKWGLLALLLGGIGGVIGAAFHHALHFVTEVRGEYSWVIFLLPLGGLLSICVYRVFKMTGNRGTNEIIDAILEDRPVPAMVAPVIFLASSLSHLFGASAGREGAALQLGGSVASGIGRLLKLEGKERTVVIMSGMSAVFAGLFGTPLTAALFCMEFESVGVMFSPAMMPCFLAAYTASRISGMLGVHAETFPLDTVLNLTADNAWRLLILALLVGVLGILMCHAFHRMEHFAARKLPDPLLRIAVGGVLITVMTLLVGDQRYNGAGMDMALGAVAGGANWYDFLLKLLFTAVTLSAGFKGGEIVPTFCVGATFGCVVGGLLGLDAGVCGALGLIGLFCCATNSPIASIVLSVEMFGAGNLYLFALVSVIAFVISGNWGLYSSQIIKYSKARFTVKYRRGGH